MKKLVVKPDAEPIFSLEICRQRSQCGRKWKEKKFVVNLKLQQNEYKKR
jgi:hypothetical protein